MAGRPRKKTKAAATLRAARPDRSCARVPGPTSLGQRPKKGDRVHYIQRRIAELTWIRGLSDIEAAGAWSISLRHVQLDAGEAQRRCEDIGTDAELRAEALISIRASAQTSIALRELAIKSGQVRSAIEAERLKLEVLKLFVEVTGSSAAKKHDVGGEMFDFLRLALEGNDEPTDDRPADPDSAEALEGSAGVRS